MAKTEALALLADGKFHSGQELADLLGVSRTAVWKQLGKLQDLGLDLESARGKGYRINGGIELLDAQRIRAALSTQASVLLTELQLAIEIDSTNAELLRRLQRGPASRLVCSAEQQTAGRGRRGRSWVSPFGSNIYLSLAWEFAGGAAALEGLSLAVGVAVATALDNCGVQDLKLKWPNDLLHGGAKLGGILIEMVGDAAGSCQVVVGVGLNVRMPVDAAADIDQQWTDVTMASGLPVGRNQLLAALLNELLPLLSQFAEQGFAPWREPWMALDAHADSPVIVSSGERRLTGVARGVDHSGALLLEVAGSIQAIHGGEVSLRPA